MKKCLSLLIALSMLMSICVLPVSVSAATPAIPEGATLIYAEDFESGYASGNLLAADKTSVTIKNGEKDVMAFSYNNATKQSATVEAGPSEFNTSNVLKLSNTDYTNFLTTVFKLNGDSAISEDYDSKQIVVEYDVYIPSSSAALRGNTGFMTIAKSSGTPCLYHSWDGKGLFAQSGYYPRDPAATYPYDKDWYVRASIGDFTTKKTVKYVVERNMTDFDSIRLYANNAIVKSQFNYQTEWNTTNGVKRTVKDFINEASEGAYQIGTYETGAESVVYPAIQNLTTGFRSKVEGTAAIVYLDNIKVYAIEPINFVGLASKTSVNPEAGIQVAFDQPFNATTSTFSVTDVEGNAVEGASITAVEMSADKKIATVKVSGLADSTEYKLLIDDEFTSAAGAIFHKDLDGVAADEEYVVLDTFKTYTAFKLAEEVANISGLIPNDPRNVEFKTTGAVESISATFTGGAVKTSTLGASAFVSFADIATPVDGTLAVTITAKDGQTFNLSIPVTAVSDEIDYIYNDNLEGMAEGSLITDGTGTSYTNGNLVFNTNATDLATAGTAEIVKDPTQGNVLKITSNVGASKKDFSVVRKGDESSVLGKVLVLRTKYYRPSTYKALDTNRGGAASLAGSFKATGVGSTPDFRLRDSSGLGYNSGEYNSNYMEYGWQLAANTWTEVVTVIDQTREGTLTDPHISRRYELKLDGTEVMHYVEAWDKKAGETKTEHMKKMYDVPPNGYAGIWNFSARAATKTSDGTTKFKVDKMYGTYTDIMPKTADEGTNYIMIDDYVAFYADRFAVTSVSNNADAFIPTKHTLKVVFNQKVTEDQLANLYLVDEEGTKVEGWTAEVANGGYAYDIKLPIEATVIGKTYTFYATPLFHEKVSYQGLTRNNVDIAVASATIADFVAFTATATPAAITAFEQGRTAKSVIALSVATKLTDSDVKSAFKVVNSKGEEVTEGWTATVAADQMSITLDFTNLATDNYTVTSNDKLVNKDGDGLDGADVEISIVAKQGRIMLFEEDFESDDYVVGDNWLEAEKLPANGKWDASTSNQNENTKVSVENTLPAENTKLEGKFLRVVANDGAVTTHTYVNGIVDEIDESLEQYQNKVIIMETDFYAKSVANGINPMLAAWNDEKKPTTTYMKHDGTALKYEGSWLSGSVKDSAASTHTRWKAYMPMSSTNEKNKNGTFVTVIDQRNAMDTVKTLFEGYQLVETSNTLLTDHALYQQKIYEVPIKSNTSANGYWNANDAGNFTGFIVYAKNQNGYGNSDFYVDNIKVYLVDAFEIASVEGASLAFNAAKNTVKINFTNKVLSLEDAAANINLVDAAGNVVEGGLTLSLAEEGYQVVAKINEEKIAGSQEYKVVVTPTIKDEYGQPLAHKYEDYAYTSTGGTGWAIASSLTSTSIAGLYTTKEAAEAAAGTTKKVFEYSWKADGAGKVNAFSADMTSVTSGTFNANAFIRDEKAMKLATVIKLTKSTSLYAEAANAVVSGANVKTALTLTNPEEEAMPVWYIVAAYGAYNEMIGCQAAQLEVAAGDIANVDIDFNAKSENIESIKLYVWDGYKTMVPYQDAEELKK